MIFQHSTVNQEGGAPSPWRALPFWLVLLVFEAALWLLLAMKFRQPCAPVALATGLTFGLAVRMGGLRGMGGASVALLLTAVTSALVLYALAAFHAARVLGLQPLRALADTGVDFARTLLEGLLSPIDWWFIAGGVALAAAFGFGGFRRRAASAP